MKEILKYINRILFVALVGGSLFAVFPFFMDSVITSKWIFTIILVGIICITLGIELLCERTLISCDVNFLFIIIVLCTTIQAVYALSCYCLGMTSIKGSFDNPLGLVSCICFAFPFALMLLEKATSRIAKFLCLMAIVIILLTVFVSSLRCGILAIVTVGFMQLYMLYKKKVIIYVGILVFSLTCFISLCIKQDSTQGRILIWNCSLEMIKDAPFSGYGSKGFDAHYMDYQANYFQRYPLSKYAQLADNTRRPFNEFLNLSIKYGIGSVLLLVGLMCVLAYSYKRYPSKNAFACILSLISIAVFSAFSYPFEYPFTWIISALCVIILLIPMVRQKLSLRVIPLILFVFSGTILIRTYKKVSSEIYWYLANKCSGQESLNEFYRLYPYQKTNAFFLYNYAAVLYKYGENKKALSVAGYCRKYLLADYDLELLMANLYKSEKNT